MAGKPGGTLPNASAGPVVQRRVGSQSQSGGATVLPAPGPPGRGAAANPRQKPSVRETIQSIESTGSQAEYFKPEQTIILFDWDDTLCPSNWIRDNRPATSFFKPAPPGEKYQKPLRELQKRVEDLLKLALKMGKVVIVTNAMETWVETSCRNFLPLLMPLVMPLPIIYARSIYDQYHCDPPKKQAGSAIRASSGARSSGSSSGALPGLYSANGANRLSNSNARLQLQQDEMLPQRWKELVFEQEITGFYSRYQHQSWKNVISIGDSIFERDAVRRVVVNRPTANKKCRTKTAKLLDEPEIHELIAQVKIIYDALGLMVQYDGNLDIEIDEEDLKVDREDFSEKIMDQLS